MKKIILLLSVIGVFSIATAQRTTTKEAPQKLFDEGKQMFHEKNYAGAHDLLTKYNELGTNANQIEEAEYLMAASAFYQNSPNSGDIMKEFLNNYPETIHHNQIKFLIGSYHFD